MGEHSSAAAAAVGVVGRRCRLSGRATLPPPPRSRRGGPGSAVFLGHGSRAAAVPAAALDPGDSGQHRLCGQQRPQPSAVPDPRVDHRHGARDGHDAATPAGQPLAVAAVAVAPRAAVAAALAWPGEARSEADAAVGSERLPEGGQPPVALPRSCRFAAFACVGSTGEALNDMATDLTIRGALSAGNTSLTLSYNCAVILSMCGGYLSERAASGPGARRAFASLWGLCQLCRGLGMRHLTPEPDLAHVHVRLLRQVHWPAGPGRDRHGLARAAAGCPPTPCGLSARPPSAWSGPCASCCCSSSASRGRRPPCRCAPRASPWPSCGRRCARETAAGAARRRTEGGGARSARARAPQGHGLARVGRGRASPAREGAARPRASRAAKEVEHVRRFSRPPLHDEGSSRGRGPGVRGREPPGQLERSRGFTSQGTVSDA
ncbi:unnamed protein product [Prorocentrum cordatum]|uniref:Solute carrier family 40 protein n=1 Tax=Prorocentrum cordatum TaxID=2364126 RepID=A0ABN9U8K2_9DINO|nr:unnamed protein product [Polarella glacialis]